MVVKKLFLWVGLLYLALFSNSPKKPTPQPGAQKRASSEVPTHQKKLLTNHLLKKVVLKCQLTKKAISQPATPDAK